MVLSRIVFIALQAVIAFGSSGFTDGPPAGPNNIALCPVTGVNLTITDATPSLEFKNGQKLYFASEGAAAAYRKEPRAFWLSPFESPLPMPDGARGLPDLRGSTLHCPFSNESIHVGMKSVRLDHRHGQAIYFCCHYCLISFWEDPQSAFATSSKMEDFGQKLQEQPAAGPKNIAVCPVTGVNVTITDATPSVDFQNGQKLYFTSEAAAEAYRREPKAFWLSPFQAPAPILPDLSGSTLRCPYSNESIAVGMRSVIVMHRHGQVVYFCCHGCVTRFWSQPQTAFTKVANAKVTIV
jgi:YHS domain-containing protein